VDPQHIDVIVAAAQDTLDRFGCPCRVPDELCLAHLVIALLRPSVTAWEAPL
jgi:hypothetical protein